MDPLLAGILHDERAQRKGEGNGHADVAEIEHRRVDDHLRILQQRVQSVAVGRNLSADQAEWMGREVHQQQEEYLHRSDDRRGMGCELRIDFVAQSQH